MIMDSKFTEFSDYINGSQVDDGIIPPNSDQYQNLTNGFKFNVPSPDLSFMDAPFVPPDPGPAAFAPSVTVISDGGSFSVSSGWSPEGYSSSPSDDSDSSDPVLKYISQMLMEENMEQEPSMFNDLFALQDTEKSLYEVLGEQYPPPNNQPQNFLNLNVETPDSKISGSSSDYGVNRHSGNSSSSTSSGTSNFVDYQWVGDVGKYNPSSLQVPLPDDHFQTNSQQPSLQFSVNSTNSPSSISNGQFESPSTELLVQNMFSDNESVLQFKRGFEEASKFLPSSNQLIIDLESSAFARVQNEVESNVVVKVEKNEAEHLPDGSRGRKNHEREVTDLEEERSNKHSAVYVEESELSDLFDKVLLCNPANHACAIANAVQYDEDKTLQKNGQSNGSNGGKTRGKRQGKKKETVDLRTLLILCAQAVSADDRRTAGELLKQVREHSSATGDGSQRLAHYFANGLEARLNGSGASLQSFFGLLIAKKTTAADMLKAYKDYLCACPFKKLSIFFANKMICKKAEKAAALHIVDFGILYGFQWPILIQKLSMRPGGPPKLRITGIEFPQRGFRPAERIVETGRRLAKYCERFGVPFVYNPIAVQNWESIPIEDLKLDSSEMLAVNDLFRFKNLLDETVEVDCPRNAVLKLIRKMNPDIVVQAVVNGSYNAPFFVTRFREALFHFSALYDMFDTTLPREAPSRLMLEKEFYGLEAMNVIACEGLERVERPETYKQWQVRYIRAGFRPLPLDPDLMKTFRDILKASYHKDFVIDEDGHWMLQGWKGRILYGSSCWVPA